MGGPDILNCKNKISIVDEDNLEFSKICRLCMSSQSNLKPIFADDEFKENITMFAKIEILENDELPQKVCLLCLQNLQSCLNFKNTCETTQICLRNILQRKKLPKVEFNDTSEEYKTRKNGEGISPESDQDDDKDIELDIQVMLTCEKCSYETESEKVLSEHIKKKHKKVEVNIRKKTKKSSRLQCDECGKEFTSPKMLSKHLRNHAKDEIESEKDLQSIKNENKVENHKDNLKHSCQHCSETYKTGKDLKNHIRNDHKTVLQKKCEICEKILSSIQAYRIHMRHHKDDRPYVCETCGKGFIQLVTLKEHALIHKGELPFKCPHCPHRSRQRQSLAVHIRIHTGERPYSCPLCSQTFTTSSNRAKHIRYHSDATPYHCDQCPKAYSYKEDLLDHISVVHIGVQRHQCQLCLKRFSSNSSLIHHRRVEHNIKRKYAGVGKIPDYIRMQEVVDKSIIN